jgi:peptide/nickel transport system permease protein
MKGEATMSQSTAQPKLSWFQRSERWQMFTASPMVVASAIWLLFIVLVAVFAPALVAEKANFQDLLSRFYAPFQFGKGWEFFLGADSLGRPILLQLAMGAQTSMIIAFFAVGISSAIGYMIGLIAGYFGGWVDNALLRIADILHTIPSILLALVVLFILQPSVFNVIIVLGITRIPVYLRTARAQTVEIKERTFVEVARSMGASHWRIITKEVAPLVFPTIRTLAVLEIATVILAASSLTFLGIGLQRHDVDWGMMVADGKTYLKTAWFVAVFPGVIIVLTALSASIVSNWLRAVEDPTQNILFARKPKVPTAASK